MSVLEKLQGNPNITVLGTQIRVNTPKICFPGIGHSSLGATEMVSSSMWR